MKTVMSTQTKEPLKLEQEAAAPAKNNGTPPDDPVLVSQKEFEACGEQIAKLKAAKAQAIEQYEIIGAQIARADAQIKTLSVQREVTGKFLDRMKAWGDYKALPAG